VRLDRVAQLMARRLDRLADLFRIPRFDAYCRPACARLLAHCTSSFTLAVICSATSGVTSRILALPWRASRPATPPSERAMINADSQAESAVASPRTAAATSAPSA